VVANQTALVQQSRPGEGDLRLAPEVEQRLDPELVVCALRIGLGEQVDGVCSVKLTPTGLSSVVRREATEVPEVEAAFEVDPPLQRVHIRKTP
jgi:hypothetical protein